MWGDVWHLHPIDIIVPANHTIKSVLPMHRNQRHSILIIEKEPSFGQKDVENLIKSEAQRCKEQNTLQDVSNMAVQITIKK